MIANLFIYTIMALLSYCIIYKSYVSKRGRYLISRQKPFISKWAVIFVALLFTLYNLFVSLQGIHSNNIQGDRLFYSLEFLGTMKPGTKGLEWLISFIRVFTDNSGWLFYGTTFFCIIVTFIGYRNIDGTTPISVLFLLLTQWVFCTIINIKQCYAVAFATLFFVFVFRKSNIKNTLLCLLSIILACLFHSSGFILIFVYIALKCFSSERAAKNLLILCVLTFILFIPFMRILTKISGFVFPSLSAKLSQYFGKSSNLLDGGINAIKGIPFYYITIIGFTRRKTLANKIKNYYMYLVISILASFSYLLAFYSEWLFRLIYLFYFPVAIFFGQIIKNNHNQTKRLVDYVVVLGGLFVVLYRYIILMYVNYGGFSGII